MYVVIFVTAKDKAQAQQIARRLLQEKLIACANIIPGVNSFFWWEKKIDQSQETLLVIKSKKSLFGKIVKIVKACHSYSVPEIIALPIVQGEKNYLKWLKESVI